MGSGVMLGRVVGAGLLALLATMLLVPPVRALATRRGWICSPRADRWSRRTVALMGGIAIFAGTAVGLVFLGADLDRRLAALLIASALMFVVGAIDDRLHLTPHSKLLCQLLAAVMMVHAGFRFGLPGPVLSVIDPLLTVFWLIGVGNAFNLLDNMDGLCAGIAAIGAAFLALLQAASGNLAAAVLAASLAGACLGFLRFNRPPASIFMGDCGSLFIGFYLAGAVLLQPGQGGGRGLLSILALPVLLMLIPLMDTTLVTVMRKLHGRPVSQGGRDHSSHRLVAIGLSERRAVGLLYAVAACGGLAALAVQQLDWYLSTALLAAVVFGTGALAWTLGAVKIYDDGSRLRQLFEQTTIPLLAQHRYRRRLGELLVDTVSIAAAWFVAFALRYESGLSSAERLLQFRETLPAILGGHLIAFYAVGVYRGIWRYTSVSDLPRFVLAASFGLLLSLAALSAVGLLDGLSPALLVIDWLLQVTLLTATRCGLKLLRDRLLAARDPQGARILGVGIGPSAELEIRRFRENPHERSAIIGLIATQDVSVGLELLGVPILGTPEHVGRLLGVNRIDEVMLLDERFPAPLWKKIRQAAAEAGVAVQIVKRTVEPAGQADADAAD